MKRADSGNWIQDAAGVEAVVSIVRSILEKAVSENRGVLVTALAGHDFTVRPIFEGAKVTTLRFTERKEVASDG